jgi:hypothetical protein
MALAADQVKYREAASIGDDGFGINQVRASRQRRDCSSSQSKSGREVVAVTGDEPDTGTVAARDDAEVVVLDFIPYCLGG